MINLTHYDLDGIVSHLLLRQFIKSMHLVATGYNKLQDRFDQALRSDRHLIITDLTFSQKDIKRLQEYKQKVLIIDHHKSSNFINKEIKKNQSNLTHYINTKYCAAANVLKFFKDKYNFSQEFKKLVYLTNDYDLWILREIESQILNFIFWKEGADMFLYLFENGYQDKVIDSYRFAFTKYQNDVNDTISSANKEDIEFDGLKVLLVYSSKYVNEVTLLYPDYDVYFIVTSETKLSIRLGNNFNANLENAMLKLDLESIQSVGYHDKAGGVTLKDDYSIEDYLIDIIEVICTELVIPF